MSTLKVDLPAEIFDVQVNVPLIHQVVVAQQAAARQGTASTKRRGEVRGGGRKPHKQKGTGRARQGSTRAPQFTGGGVVHGPKPRDYDQRTPKKMKAAALKGALSDRARNGRVHVVESLIDADKPSTRAAIASLAAISGRRRFLVVLERVDTVTWLSLRNAPDVHIVAVDQVNTYDVLLSDDVVFTKGAFEAFIAGAPTGKSVKAVATESEAAPIVDTEKKAPKAEKAPKADKAEKAPKAPKAEVTAFAAVADEDFAGAAQPLEGGEAPEGFEIKGNADSMKFHAPTSPWFGRTKAEVWFRTAEAAEAAGFVNAEIKA